MTKTFSELMAMSDEALEAYAKTLKPKSFVSGTPGTLDGLERLRAFLDDLKTRDLSDLCVVEEILSVRQDIAHLETLKRKTMKEPSPRSTTRVLGKVSEAFAFRPAIKSPRTPRFWRILYWTAVVLVGVGICAVVFLGSVWLMTPAP